MKRPCVNFLRKLRLPKAIRSPLTWLPRPSRHLTSASCALRSTASEKMPCSRVSTILVGRYRTRKKLQPTNNAGSKKPRGYLASRFLFEVPPAAGLLYDVLMEACGLVQTNKIIRLSVGADVSRPAPIMD